MGLKEQGVAMATAWHALSPGKRKCHSLRGLNRKRVRKTEAERERERGTGMLRVRVNVVTGSMLYSLSL